MDSELTQRFLELRKHLRIAHHIPGRIRLRINATAFRAAAAQLDRKVMDRILGAVDGISDLRVNAAAGSITISYLPRRLEPTTWEALLQGPADEASALLDELLRTRLAAAATIAREQ